jgi:hypothetical protein
VTGSGGRDHSLEVLRSVRVSVVAGATDDESRSVGVMHDRAGDASQQHRAHSREATGAHHDRRRIALIGELDDRLPHRSGGLDGDWLGLQARVLRYARPGLGDVSGVLRGGAIELEEVDHVCCRPRPGEAAQAMGRLPNGQNQRMPAAEQGTRAFDRVPGIVRSVVAEEQRAVRTRGHGSAWGLRLRTEVTAAFATGRPDAVILLVDMALQRSLGCRSYLRQDVLLVDPHRQTVAGG